mgnify:CR=1 FL=1
MSALLRYGHLEAIRLDGQAGIAMRHRGGEDVHRRATDEGRYEPVGRVIVQILWRFELLQFPGVHHGDAVRHRESLLLVVCDINRRHPRRLCLAQSGRLTTSSTRHTLTLASSSKVDIHPAADAELAAMGEFAAIRNTMACPWRPCRAVSSSGGSGALTGGLND